MTPEIIHGIEYYKEVRARRKDTLVRATLECIHTRLEDAAIAGARTTTLRLLHELWELVGADVENELDRKGISYKIRRGTHARAKWVFIWMTYAPKEADDGEETVSA